MKSLFGRRILIVIGMACVLGVFLGLYYFVYAPQQQSFFNRSGFRILDHIASNFKERVENYGTVIITENLSKSYQTRNDTISSLRLEGRRTMEVPPPVEGKVAYDSLYHVDKRVDGDSIVFLVRDQFGKLDSGKKSTTEIIEPIVRVHNNIFESVIFSTHNEGATDTVLFKSGDISIDKIIKTDSLLKDKGAFIFPEIKDVTIEGLKYKLFIYPFRIDNQPYLLAGFLTSHDYKVYSQDFPLSYVLGIGILIMIALLSLPFMKIFLIGAKENIAINDVRAIIAMLYIIPFLFLLIGFGGLVNKVEGIDADKQMMALHEQVKDNFYHEIKDVLDQLKLYDSLYSQSGTSVTSGVEARINKWKTTAGGDGEEKVNIRDLYFYPSLYKNMDGVYWINNKGDEIAKWNFVNRISTYLHLSDRQYFKDITSQHGFRLPISLSDSFSIQPTISRATGDYTVNIVKPSKTVFRSLTNARNKSNESILVGISGKMYSVFKPVVPKGLNFCIINEKGDIQYHSESDRSLQENFFDELENRTPFVSAVNQRDSAIIEGNLYERDIKALVTPVDGLPYYLVTYYKKRNQHLFTFHVLAFTFVCESMVLLVLSLFILFFYFTTRRFTKLFFLPHALEWIKPNFIKAEYYQWILAYQGSILLVLVLFYFIVPDAQWLNYILVISLLLPFFVVMGYYMLRSAETHAFRKASLDTNKSMLQGTSWDWSHDLHFRNYLFSVGKILLPYIILILLFLIYKDNLKDRSMDQSIGLSVILWFLVFFIPAGAMVMSARWYYKLTQKIGKLEVFEVNEAGSLLNEQKTSEKKITSVEGRDKKDIDSYLKYLSFGLLFSIVLIAIIPTLGFLIYASRQEKTLQAKSNQMYFAKKIEEHRDLVNKRVARAKFNSRFSGSMADEDYIDSLKFGKQYGLYLDSNSLIYPTVLPSISEKEKFWNSTFYKKITDYLFLPPDHFDFYNNTKEYFWTIKPRDKKTDTLSLYYANLTDNRDTSSLALTVPVTKTVPLRSYLTGNDKFLIFLISVLAFGGLLSLILSLTRRVFLIGYFEAEAVNDQDPSRINKLLNSTELNEKEKVFWGITTKAVLELKEKQLKETGVDPEPGMIPEYLTIRAVQRKENEFSIASDEYAEWILKIQMKLTLPYEKIWDDCSAFQKSVLYDFALDGFTNYRNVDILYSLYRDGIIKKERQTLAITTDSFRNYLITKRGSSEIETLQKQVSEGGTWGNLRAIFYVLLFAIIIFLFIVQEDVSKRVLAIVTSLGALIPIVLKLFDTASSSKSSSK